MAGSTLLLATFFLITAGIYATVGFGGGSTYLALLFLFGLPYTAVPKIALICNLAVVSGSLYHYVRGNHLRFERVIPFLLTSLPAAYIGGRVPVSKELFLSLAAISLTCAGIRLLSVDQSTTSPRTVNRPTLWSVGIISGAVLGFVSGLVGIGGGIFLSPLLYFLRWGDAREIAAMSCLFIFANSFSGLAGQFMKSTDPIEFGLIFPLILAVLVGGQIGNQLGIRRIPLSGLQRATAILILLVAGRIFWMLTKII